MLFRDPRTHTCARDSYIRLTEKLRIDLFMDVVDALASTNISSAGYFP